MHGHDIAASLESIRNRMAAAAEHSLLAQRMAELIAVSKGQPQQRIAAALAAGQRSFGENKVQEAAGKWPQLRESYPDIRLHLIGPLQSNKAADAVALFDVIHTLDREKIARALATEMDKAQRQLPCFVQVNTGEEPQKAGILPKEAPSFIRYCREELQLCVIGLMCIPPQHESPAQHFGLLQQLALREGLEKLSMGMSDDFVTGIRFGASHIRVGTALFGARDYPPH